VLKPVSPGIREQVQNTSRDLRKSQSVRLPIDSVKDEMTFVYPHFTEDLTSFVKSHDIPVAKMKRILRNVLEGLKAIHDKDWIHGGMKQAHSSAEVLCQR
jgi:serine/threonine protein kinase